MDIPQNSDMKIYAIILSYDDNHIYVDNLLFKMQNLWPNSNLIFRIPYNTNKPDYLKDKYKDISIEFIKTPTEIKKTVLTLIEDLNSNDWIYWCIDDKFPVILDYKKIKLILERLSKIQDNNISGITFCRARKLKDNSYFEDKEINIENKVKLIKLKRFKQFWMHQFFRVNIIRAVFNSFPDHNFKAKDMDKYIKKFHINEKYEFYATEKNYAVFCESARRGVATQSLKYSLKEAGITNYSNKKFSDVNIIMGKMDTIAYYYFLYKSYLRKILESRKSNN